MRFEQARQHRDPCERIVVEITLLHPAVFHGDLEPERRTEAVDGAALQLRIDAVGMHGEATVDRRDDALDRQLAIGDRHLHRMRGVAAECEVRGQPDAPAFRQALAVADAFGNEAQQSCQPARVECRSTVAGVFQFARLAQEVEPQLQRILSRFVRDFIDETLDHEGVRRVGRRAPGAAR